MAKAMINGFTVEIHEGETILQTAQRYGIPIPTMCYVKDLDPEGACRLCMVEIEGREKLVTACSTKICEGMVIETETEKTVKARKAVLSLMLSNHPANCGDCAHSGICKLQEYCIQYGVDKTEYPGEITKKETDDSNPYIAYDPNLCVLCHRCENVCNKVMHNGAIATVGRGFGAQIGTAFGVQLAASSCDSCGNCVEACSTGALSFKRQADYRVWQPQRTVRAAAPGFDDGRQVDIYCIDYKVVDVRGVEDGPANGILNAKARFESMDKLQELADAKLGYLQ